MQRRYLVVPGIASSRVHILDTKPNPKEPKIVKVIEPEELIKKTGYTSPHTIHCGPDGVFNFNLLWALALIITGLFTFLV